MAFNYNDKFSGRYDERAVELGRYIAETNSTVRATGKKFGISKSTVHIVVTVTEGLSGWWYKVQKTNKIKVSVSDALIFWSL
jgi:putative DeoR family transcriptional regulator (stage III sporulation protein D)